MRQRFICQRILIKSIINSTCLVQVHELLSLRFRIKRRRKYSLNRMNSKFCCQLIKLEFYSFRKQVDPLRDMSSLLEEVLCIKHNVLIIIHPMIVLKVIVCYICLISKSKYLQMALKALERLK